MATSHVYLPHDAGAARPRDLDPQPPAPAPSATAAHAWPQEDPSAAPFHYIGQALTPAEFRQYCLDYDFGSSPPSYWIWHHTWNPDASWAPASSDPATWWDRNEQGMTAAQKQAKRKPQLDAIMRYYRDSLGWTVGPHLFIDDLFIWLFCPMYYVGIHANEGNSYHTSSGQLRYSIGCEVVGAYDAAPWPASVRAMAGWAVACVKARLGMQLAYTSAPQDRPDLHDTQLSGHRDYTTEKTCPGKAITPAFFVQAANDGWAAYQAGTVPGPTPADPLRARTIPGAPGTPAKYCSVGMADYYAHLGGLGVLGYPRADAWHDARYNAAVLSCQRGVIKESPQYGVELALLNEEALPRGWIA